MLKHQDDYFFRKVTLFINFVCLFPYKGISETVAQKCSVKEGVLRNFAKLTGKRLCQSLFFNKVAGGPATVL